MSQKIKKIKFIINDKGMFFLISLTLKIIYFKFYSKKFKNANGIYLKKGFMISGHKNISLGFNFRAGLSLRLEAITSYHKQHFKPNLIIGDNVFINDYVHIGCVNYIKIGNNVLMASKIYIGDHNHGYYGAKDAALHEKVDVPPSDRLLSKNLSIIIEDNVWVGESVSILPGSFIGRGAIIGANSVVNGVIPPSTIAVGNPALVVKKFCDKDNIWKAERNSFLD